MALWTRPWSAWRQERDGSAARYARWPRYRSSTPAGTRRFLCRVSSRTSTPRLRRALEGRGVTKSSHHSGRSHRLRARRTARGRHHADRIGEDLMLQRPDSPGDPAGSVEPGAVSLSNQGAGSRSTRGVAGTVRNNGPESGDHWDWGVHLRRRHSSDAIRTIRSRAHLVFSNPDMLHSGILPHHPRWAKLFENLS